METIEHDSHVKCVVLGMSNVGKTSMLISYYRNEFPAEDCPEVFDAGEPMTCLYEEKMIAMDFVDTPGRVGKKDYCESVTQYFPGTDVYMLCVSLIDLESVEFARNEILPLVQKAMSPQGVTPGAHLIVVGLKEGLRNQVEDRFQFHRTEPGDDMNSVMTWARFKEFGRSCGAAGWYEMNAKTRHGMQYAFSAVLSLKFHGVADADSLARRRRPKRCVVS